MVTAGDVRGFYDALGCGDTTAISGRLADDVILEFPGRRFGGRFEGRRRVELFLRQNQRLFRDGLRFDVFWTGIVGDRAVAQWTNEGTTRDGVTYGNRGVTIFRFAGEKIVEIQDYFDTERISETWSR